MRQDKNSDRLPDFIIIGAQKGGTSYLYQLLANHPEIVRADLNEVHYFDDNFHRGLDWYISHFPSSEGISAVGEKTP